MRNRPRANSRSSRWRAAAAPRPLLPGATSGRLRGRPAYDRRDEIRACAPERDGLPLVGRGKHTGSAFGRWFSFLGGRLADHQRACGDPLLELIQPLLALALRPVAVARTVLLVGVTP